MISPKEIEVVPDKSLGWLGDPKIRPSGEMEVPNGPDCIAPHHSELVDVPVRKVRLIQDGDLINIKKLRR